MKINRREFIKQSTVTAAALSAGLQTKAYASKKRSGSGKKVIVIGIDGMDPGLAKKMMVQGKMPNLKKLANKVGLKPLGTSTPPQSTVAWANFINGAGPGSH